MLTVMDKPILEETLSQLLQTKIKLLEILVPIFMVCNGIFNVTNENNKFILVSVFEYAEYNVIKIARELKNWKVQKKKSNQSSYVFE